MADISVIKLPNSSSYNIKDAQALGSAQFSGHELTFNKRGTGQQVLDLGDFDNLNVTDANVGNLIVTGGARFMNGAEGLTYPDLKPLEKKIYESTSQYATAGNSAKAAFFFMSVKPDEWNKPWTVRFKVRSYCPSYANYDSVTYATWSGSENNIAYANWNQRAYYIGHYYLAYYPLTQAGFNAGYGHAIAINLLYATSYTYSAYYRTFEVEYYECENCTVTLLDSPILWENWSGGNTTNYGGMVNTNAADRGLQETGDANSTSISTFYNQYGHWIASTDIKRYEMLFSVDDRHLVALNELDNQYTNTEKELSTTTKFDPLGKIYYYNSGSLYSADATIDSARLYYSVLADMRYTFNISSNNATNTYTCAAATPCYLKVSIGTDGMATIADDTQPLTSTLPSSADGYYYIYLGRGHDWYRIMLSTDHPVYCYTNHGLERYLGKTVKTDIVDGTTFTGNAATATTASKVSGVAGATNAARHVWFSDSVTETSRNYDDDFKYNPSTNTLTVGSITGSAVSATNAANDESGNNIKSSYASSISISGNTITLKNKNNESLGTVTVPDNNTDTWRAIQVNGTQILAGNVSTALNLKAGTNVSLSNSSGTVTIAATDTKYSAGVGLDLSSTTFKAKLKSETNSNQESATVGTTANRQYAVHPDKSGYLSVNVPWTDTTKATAFNSVREIKLTGDVTGSASADGSSGWSIATTVADNSHTHYVNNITYGNSATSGALDPITGAYIGSATSNKTFGLPANAITIEYSTDGGETWVDYGATDAQKKDLFAETRGTSFFLGKSSSPSTNSTNNRLRVTIEPIDRYVTLNGIYIWLSSSGSTVYIDLERSTIGAKDTFTTVFTGQQISGWSGNNIRYFSGSTFGGGSTQTSNSYKYRITFYQTAVNTSYGSANVSDIRFLGANVYGSTNNMVAKNHLYTWNSSLDATFPAQLTATKFIGDVTGNVSGTSSGVLDAGNNSATTTFAYSKSGLTANWTTTPWFAAWNGYELRAISAANMKTTLGLNNVDNTADANKSVASAAKFTSAQSVALTGDTTGSASSQAGWSIVTKTDRISTVGDNRSVATTPNDYSNKLIFQGLKAKATIGNPSSDNYSYVIGLRGYGDNSGGKAHELAFNNSGINRRTGSTTTWDSWVKLIDSGNYTDYTVKKDGTGASGTWGISISGNATTATSATSATTATSANKLNTNAGSYLSPVYFSSGIPVATQGNSIPYIVGTSTTAGTWLGTLDGFDDYYDGMMICYKPNVAGASTTTLNLNNKGAKTIYVWNTSKLTTHFPANQPIFLVYTSTLNSGCWVVTNDYWANSDHYTTAWSNTAAGTAAKIATCTNYVLLAKSYINVLIVNANTSATALTLNINNTGAKAIYINGSASSTSNHTLPAGSYLVYYDGTNYYFRTDGKITCDITGNAHTATNLTGFTNTTNSATAIDSAITNGIYYVNGASGIYNQSDGSAIVQAWSSNWVSQIYQDYRTGQIALRGKNNGTWQSWRKVLDTGNWSTTITHSSLGLGTIATYNAATAGTKDTWGLVPVIGASDGVMEVGKYIDFHTTDGNVADYDARITAATTGLTLSGTTVGTFSGNLSGTNISASGYVTVNSGNSGTAGGLALYSTNPAAYGIAMRNISNGGAHGYVSGDWATYFYMSGTSAANSLTRGWIFKNVSNGNIASISGAGNAVFNGSVTIGGSINNSAGCRMEYDETNECVQWIFN